MHTQFVLDYLRAHKTITQKEAVDGDGDYRLAATIGRLRDKGHTIITHTEQGTNRHGKPTRYARYELVKEAEQ